MADQAVLDYYLRDDGELMIEVQPGEFVSESAAQRGLVHPNVLADIARIKAVLKRPVVKRPIKQKASKRKGGGSPHGV